MAFVLSTFFVSYLTCLTTIELSQAHPMRGVNVRDATSSDNLSFVVSIGRINHGGKHFCTGTLITRQSVLTCQHCIYGENKTNVQLTIGSKDLRLGQHYRVSEWKSFNQWYFRTLELEPLTVDDIAIITLDRKVYDPNVKPALISYSGILGYLNNSRLRIVGWGLIDNGMRPMILKTGLVKPILLQECLERGKNATGGVDIHIATNYFCSLADPWLLADCGDSGGPTLNENNQLIALTTGVCPIEIYYGFSTEYRDRNLMNNHLSLFIYRRFIKEVAIQDRREC